MIVIFNNIIFIADAIKRAINRISEDVATRLFIGINLHNKYKDDKL